MPKNKIYSNIILIGNIKKPIIDEAIYTRKALLIDPLISEIGINNDAKVRILIVLIGIRKFKYKIMLVSATKTALKVISFAFIT